jgi:hypothetical protein
LDWVWERRGDPRGALFSGEGRRLGRSGRFAREASDFEGRGRDGDRRNARACRDLWSADGLGTAAYRMVGQRMGRWEKA